MTAIISFVFVVSGAQSVTAEESFDLDTGNAVKDVAIPTVTPVILENVSPGVNDISLVLRWTTLMSQGWFDALAPYHDTAVGISSRIDRQPQAERTTRNKNIAILYASYRVFSSLRPESESVWRKMLSLIGLDPDDDREDMVSAVGVGNIAGNAVVASRENDGMNQLGNEGGRTYNRVPYSDYTGYEPVNSAYRLTNPGRWQPAVVSNGDGLFEVQQFVTPQLRLTRPYSFDDADVFETPSPVARRFPADSDEYKQQVDNILEVSARLNDRRKMSAELFDNKFDSLGNINLFLGKTKKLSMTKGVHVGTAFNIANFDTAIAMWNEKHRHDTVRPFSAVRHIYGDDEVTAWGGPGQGTVSDIMGREWRSYLRNADHPEYPSVSAAVCAAQAQAGRRFFESDELGFTVSFPAGSSKIEPEVTPSTDLELTFDTWSELARQCALSRVWGGVHFEEAIEVGAKVGTRIGDRAYEFVQRHIDGNV